MFQMQKNQDRAESTTNNKSFSCVLKVKLPKTDW